MQYLITFLEGVISFISPCMLPMLPLYISYFAAGSDKKRSVLINSVGFMVGFTALFTAMGLFAGSLGSFLSRWQTAVNIICGLIVILLGLSYLEVIRIPFFKGAAAGKKVTGFFSAALFGIVYSVSLTPCVGAFLGSALMLASTAGGAGKGAMLLLCYSLGLGLPFILSAVLIDKLGTIFTFIKSHYRIVNIICGVFLIVIGVMMMFGWMNRVMALFS